MKGSEYLTTDTDLKKVADAIRATTGGTAPLSFPDGFVSAIAGGVAIRFGSGTTSPLIMRVSKLTFLEENATQM